MAEEKLTHIRSLSESCVSLPVVTSASLSNLKATYHALPLQKYSILQQEEYK